MYFFTQKIKNFQKSFKKCLFLANIIFELVWFCNYDLCLLNLNVHKIIAYDFDHIKIRVLCTTGNYRYRPVIPFTVTVLPFSFTGRGR